MMESVLRHRAALAALAGTLLLGLAATGCGEQRADDADRTTSEESQPSNDEGNDDSGDSSVADGPEKSPDASGLPPITLHRSGGFAGHIDELVISKDGSAALSSRGQQKFTCDVTSEALESLVRNTKDLPKPKLKPAVPPQDSKVRDAITMTLNVGDQEVQRDRLTDGEKQWKQLFTDTGRILSSADALRNGSERPKDGLYCTGG